MKPLLWALLGAAIAAGLILSGLVHLIKDLHWPGW